MKRVFISYRRFDSQYATGRIHDWLDLHFCREGLFFRDIEDIPFGQDFNEAIKEALSECVGMLVVIGPQWLSEVKARSLQKKGRDLVLEEIAFALRSKIRVIPLLLKNTVMPQEAELPKSIRKLAAQNACPVRADGDFKQDMRHVAKTIEKVIEERPVDFSDLLRNCRRCGLVSFDTTFHAQQFEGLIENSKELLVVLNDGRGWIDTHREAITHRLQDTSKSTRLILIHPRSEFVMTLIKKNKKSKTTQIEEIKRSFEALQEGNPEAGRLEIRGHHKFNPISLHLNEEVAIVSHYLFNEAGDLPSFTYFRQAEAGYYNRLLSDAELLFREAEPLTKADFQ